MSGLSCNLLGECQPVIKINKVFYKMKNFFILITCPNILNSCSSTDLHEIMMFNRNFKHLFTFME